MTSDPTAAEAAPARAIYQRLQPGDRFPLLRQACGDGSFIAFNTLAGRYQLYGFFLSAEEPAIRQAIDAVAARHDLFDDRHATFIGVSITSADRARLADADPTMLAAWDFDRTMSNACGVTPLNAGPGGGATVLRKWILVDPSLHVLRVWPMRETPVEEVIAAIEALPPPDRFGGVSRPAAVLMLPNVLEPELCHQLIDLYERQGGKETGVFRGGKLVIDPSFKRRRDVEIDDPALLQALRDRIGRRIRPEVERLFFMRADFIERHIVGCYSAADRAHFAPHIDNGDQVTAHRRFAVSINLSEGFEGGEIVFPEYDMQGYKAPPGWAVVFPCAILHAVRQVTAGVRYAYLPFLYDEGGRQIFDSVRGR